MSGYLKLNFNNHNKPTRLSTYSVFTAGTGPGLFTPARSDVLTFAPQSSIVSMARDKNSFWGIIRKMAQSPFSSIFDEQFGKFDAPKQK